MAINASIVCSIVISAIRALTLTGNKLSIAIARSKAGSLIIFNTTHVFIHIVAFIFLIN